MLLFQPFQKIAQYIYIESMKWVCYNGWES